MKITNLSDHAKLFTSNVFLCEGNNEVVFIDCGSDPIIVEHAPDKIDKIIITHTHWDHIVNLPLLQQKGNPEVYAFDQEKTDADHTLKEGDIVEICGLHFEVIHTPGHINDAICLYNKEQKILFSGDTVFPDGGFGRTDLEEGDQSKMVQSLKRIATLDVQELYAGHEPITTKNVNNQIAHSLQNANMLLDH